MIVRNADNSLYLLCAFSVFSSFFFPKKEKAMFASRVAPNQKLWCYCRLIIKTLFFLISCLILLAHVPNVM